MECIDPNSKFQHTNDKIPNSANINMNLWRRKANSYIKDVNPEPYYPVNLEKFITHWQIRHPFTTEDSKDIKWPKKASLMELAYKLVTWIPELQEDDEGIVYLKAITQTITQTSFFNKYSANIDFSSPETEKESINEALLNIFVPIATGGVQIDENLFEVIPSNSSSIIRERVKKYSHFSNDERNSKDCAFDDLTRLYFVAFSRAKDVLLLVGLNPNIDGYSRKDKLIKIPNVALGWNRDEEFIGFDNIYLI